MKIRRKTTTLASIKTAKEATQTAETVERLRRLKKAKAWNDRHEGARFLLTCAPDWGWWLVYDMQAHTHVRIFQYDQLGQAMGLAERMNHDPETE